MAGMLAATVIIAAVALNLCFRRFCAGTCHSDTTTNWTVLKDIVTPNSGRVASETI